MLIGFAQEAVISRVCHAAKTAGAITGPLQRTAVGREPLHGGDVAQKSAATVVRYVKLEPRNIACGLAWRGGGDFADHGAAVGQLPGRTGVVAADSLAVEQQRRDRLTECPRQLAV